MLHRFLSEQEKAQTATSSQAQTAELETPETHDIRTVQAVNQWLAEVQKNARRGRRRYLTALILLEMLVFSSERYLRNHPTSLIASILMGAGICGTVLLILCTLLVEPDWNVDKLLQEGGVRAIGPLMELLNAPKAFWHNPPIYAALTALLPQLKSSDANLLSSRHRDWLYRILRATARQLDMPFFPKPAWYDDFVVAILKALEQVGDAQGILVVEKLANRRPRTPRERRLKEAAAACLPLLRANSTAVGEHQTLLRASTAEDQPEVLLRPVIATPEVDQQEQLLRVPGADRSDPLPPH